MEVCFPALEIKTTILYNFFSYYFVFNYYIFLKWNHSMIILNLLVIKLILLLKAIDNH